MTGSYCRVATAPWVSGLQEGEGSMERADDSTPASQVRQRYEKLLRERQRAAEDGSSPERRKEQEHAATAAGARTHVRGSRSTVCTPYLQ